MIQDIFEDAPNALIEGDRYLSAKLRTEKVNSKSEARERRGQVQGQGQGQGQASDGDDLSCAGYSQFDAEARGLLIWSPKVDNHHGKDERRTRECGWETKANTQARCAPLEKEMMMMMLLLLYPYSFYRESVDIVSAPGWFGRLPRIPDNVLAACHVYQHDSASGLARADLGTALDVTDVRRLGLGVAGNRSIDRSTDT